MIEAATPQYVRCIIYLFHEFKQKNIGRAYVIPRTTGGTTAMVQSASNRERSAWSSSQRSRCDGDPLGPWTGPFPHRPQTYCPPSSGVRAERAIQSANLGSGTKTKKTQEKTTTCTRQRKSSSRIIYDRRHWEPGPNGRLEPGWPSDHEPR